MITRLRGLLRRYMTANLVLTGEADPAHVSTPLRILWECGRLCVEGRGPAGDIALELGEMRVTDRIVTSGGAFRLMLPWPPDLPLCGTAAQLTLTDMPPLPLHLRHVRRAQLCQGLSFLVTVLRLVPDLARWLRRHDTASKARIKRALRLAPPMADGPLDGGIFDDTAPIGRPVTGPVTLIVPVHNAPDLTRTCLDRVAEHTDADWHMILVEDGSTDPRVRPMLRDWITDQPAGRVSLIEHAQNRGFIASVNAAFARTLARPAEETGPVVLLNSDALVPENWCGRLLEPLADPRVATVTPMSNDAEIFSVPAICRRSDLAPGQADQIDKVAAGLTGPATGAIAPTGVGFCMAIARPWLERVPTLDPVFGRGYGEEVDWCQKIRAMGGLHLGTARLFVEHRGGASFGQAEKAALIARNHKVIASRYPAYDQEVQDFLLLDWLRSARLALAVAWAATGPDPVPIYLAHSLGGGAEGWLQDQLNRDTAQGHGAVVLRVGGPQRWQLEVISTDGTTLGRTAGWSDDLDLIHCILAPLTRRRVIYSCGVGDPDPVTLPNHLLALLQSPQDRLEVLFHDYFPLSPSFTLLDAQGRYRGAPRPDHPGHRFLRPDGTEVALAAWQESWGRLVARADELRVFCPSSAQLVAQTWPAQAGRIRMAPHALPPGPTPIIGHPDDTSDCPVVAVLGNIAPHKGAALVQTLAQMPKAARGFSLVLIGNIDPGYGLPRHMQIHGDYAPQDIPRLARHYRVTHWLIPSVWPETFSFTTHEALATGLPVLAFDIGAQGDAVRAAPNGWALPHDPNADLATRIIAALKHDQEKKTVAT